MKLLRFVFYGAVALWGITRDAISCSTEDDVVSGNTGDTGNLVGRSFLADCFRSGSKY